MLNKAEMPYAVAALWGFLGALAYAAFRARMVLCSGERDPTGPERQKAWGEFLLSPLIGAILSGGLTPSLAHFLPWLNFVGASVVLGLVANPAMPMLSDLARDGSLFDALRKKLGSALSDIGGTISKGKAQE